MAKPQANQGILPVKISLTEGDYFTLWAPTYRQHNEEWQAFLGHGEHIYFFNSPAEVLAFIRSGQPHDLDSHPSWNDFAQRPANWVTPTEGDTYDLIGVPQMLANRPSHNAVKSAARCFRITQSLASVLSLLPIQSTFSSHSVLANVQRGSDHYAGENGLSEWSAVGRVVATNWDSIIDSLDEHVYRPDDLIDDAAVKEAEQAIAEADAQVEREKEEKEKAIADIDPYDASVWGASGIDPIKIAIEGRTLYTLRTYVGGRPVFLGHYGQIYTFNNRKAMTRWLAEHGEHDLAAVSTWQDVMDAINGGTVDVIVDPLNVYTFTGLAEDINNGPNNVDTQQLGRAYELIADAADWARDDAVSSVLVANPQTQEYLAYMLGSTSGYVPSAPYTAEVEGWRQLENGLVARFSKF